MAVTLAELARHVGGQLRGDGAYEVTAVAAIDVAGPHDLTFLADRRYLARLASTSAGAVLLNTADAEAYEGRAIVVDNPQLAFARAAAVLHPPAPVLPAIHQLALIAPGARVSSRAWIDAHATVQTGADIGDGVSIGVGCSIGRRVRIGAGTQVAPRVVIGDDCVIGANCRISAGVVIGSDGFGYAKDGERWINMPQRGRVIIGDDVDIGANTTIDRGTLTDTVIGDGVKLDNLIQVAHNVRIGAHTAIAACTGIAGSVIIGRRCTIGGHVGIAGHLTIADDVQILATSLVTKSIDRAGAYSSNLKAEPLDRWRRTVVRLNQLDDLARRLKRLEQQLHSLLGESSR